MIGRWRARPRLASTLCLSAALVIGGLLLAGCGQQDATPMVNPELGRDCFNAHLETLPPGSQFEGFEAIGDRLRVRTMTGLKVQTVDCRIDTGDDGAPRAVPVPQ